MMVPPAVAFAGDLWSRYQRLRTPRLRPVDAVLRALPAMRIDHRVLVDARSWRVVAAATDAALSAIRLAERTPAPVVMQIVERLRRDDGSAAEHPQPMAWVQPVAERLRGRGDVDTRPVRSMAMVLARQAPRAESRVVKDAVSVGDGWPSSPAPMRHATRHAEPAPAPPPIDVNHLAERVVAAIDRRMMAARERMGV